MAKIKLSRIGFDARHGVSAAERRGLRRFEVDVDIDVDTTAAESSDRLADTIDYARVAERVVEIGVNTEHNLLESLARRMLDALVDCCPAGAQVRLELRKMAPPDCLGHPEHAAITLVHPR